MDSFLRWLGEVVAVGGPAGIIAFGLLKVLAQRWIDQRLSLQLEAFKSAQQRELEKLRQFLSGRISKIHEKEFEVLPKAWLMLHEAYGSASGALLALKYRPDFTRLSPAEFDAFLASSRLPDYQKDALRATADRRGYFNKAMSEIEFGDAEEKQRVFNNYLIENRIFMTDELREKFGAVGEDISSALIEYSVGKDADDREMQHSAIKKITSLQEKIDDVEQAVQKRLHYEEA